MDLLYQIYAMDTVRGIVLQTRQKDQVKEASGDATQTLQTTVQNPELVLVNENAIWRDRMGWDQMGRLFRQIIEGVLLDTLEMEIGMELVHFTMQLLWETCWLTKSQWSWACHGSEVLASYLEIYQDFWTVMTVISEFQK